MTQKWTVHKWAALSGRRKIQPSTFWSDLRRRQGSLSRSCSGIHEKERSSQARCGLDVGHRAKTRY